MNRVHWLLAPVITLMFASFADAGIFSGCHARERERRCCCCCVVIHCVPRDEQEEEEVPEPEAVEEPEEEIGDQEIEKLDLTEIDENIQRIRTLLNEMITDGKSRELEGYDRIELLPDFDNTDDSSNLDEDQAA